jgi:Mrp family chromosome partitioning ATPase
MFKSLRHNVRKKMTPFFLTDEKSSDYLSEYINYSEIKQSTDQINILIEKNNIRTLAILSEFTIEGKSFFAATLCAALSKFYQKKVLLIDTSTTKNSFSSLVTSAKSKDPIIKKTKFENFDIAYIKDFPQKDGELTEYQIDAIAKEYSEDYSLVIIDTTAFGIRNKNNAHPLVIARRCDSSILVVSEISSNRKELDKFQLNLKDSHLNLLGVIYNDGVEHEA